MFRFELQKQSALLSSASNRFNHPTHGIFTDLQRKLFQIEQKMFASTNLIKVIGTAALSIRK